MNRPHHIARLVSILAVLVTAPALTAVAGAPIETLLQPQDGGAHHYLGASVAISGDTLVAGAHQNDGVPNPIEGPGAAYVFLASGGGYAQQAKLVQSPPQSGSWFGYDVAISGDVAVVGAPELGPGSAGPGRAFVFERSGTLWSSSIPLNAPGLSAGDAFGYTVAVDGDLAAVGLPYGNGGVHLFRRGAGGWQHEAFLAPDSGLDFAAQFGQAVAVEGDRVAVGAPGLDYTGYDSGAVYVFERSGGVWSQVDFLIADDAFTIAAVGTDVDLDGDRLVAGSMNGGAYVFERSGAAWQQIAKLEGSLGGSSSNFGGTAALDGGRAVVGGRYLQSGQGGAALFEWNGLAFVEDAVLDPASTTGDYGASVAIDGDRALIGSPGSDLAGTNSGAAHVFSPVRTGTFADLGGGVAGSAGLPHFTGAGTLHPGELATLSLTNAAPSMPAVLLYGVMPLGIPYLGGTLVPNPAPPGGALAIPTDPNGERMLAFPWPAGAPSGLPLYLQWWIQDGAATFGAAASNGLLVTTP